MKDIAPAFKEILTILPVEALNEMELNLSSKSKEPAINKAICYIQDEKKSRLKIA